jgi:hypothetical protein
MMGGAAGMTTGGFLASSSNAFAIRSCASARRSAADGLCFRLRFMVEGEGEEATRAQCIIGLISRVTRVFVLEIGGDGRRGARAVHGCYTSASFSAPNPTLIASASTTLTMSKTLFCTAACACAASSTPALARLYNTASAASHWFFRSEDVDLELVEDLAGEVGGVVGEVQVGHHLPRFFRLTFPGEN